MEISENQISYDIRGAIFEVYNALGPGLLESVYESALVYELREMGYDVNRINGDLDTYYLLSFTGAFNIHTDYGYPALRTLVKCWKCLRVKGDALSRIVQLCGIIN